MKPARKQAQPPPQEETIPFPPRGDRLPPHNLDAEVEVLGGLAFAPEMIPEVCKLVHARHFYRDFHQYVFGAMLALHNAGKPVDMIRLVEELSKHDSLERFGGVEALSEILRQAVVPSQLLQSAAVVAQKALARDAIRHAGAMLDGLYGNTGDPSEIIARTKMMLDDLASWDGTPQSEWKLDVRSAASYKVRPVDYLVEPYIPRAMVLLLAGLGGEGKSHLVAELAARLSRCEPCFGMPVSLGGEPADTLFMSCEDGREDVFKPRLIGAGADLDRIHIVEGLTNSRGERQSFDIGHLDLLRHHIEEGSRDGKNYRLAVIDPITTYVGRAQIDDHRDAQLKPALEGLTHMAQDLGVTFLCLAHINKGKGSSAVHRIMGGSSYVTSSRLVYVYGGDPDNPSRKVLSCAKTNLPDGKLKSLPFVLDAIPEPEAMALLAPHVEHLADSETRRLASQLHRVRREDGTVDLTSDDLLGGQRDRDGGEGETKIDRAGKWLLDHLAGKGPILSDDIFKSGAAAGFTKDNLHKAKQSLGEAVKATKQGFQGKWVWYAPEAPDPEDEPFDL